MPFFNFSWKKLALLSFFNILLSFLCISVYKNHQNPVILLILFFLGFVFTVVYLTMINTLSPKHFFLKFFILLLALTPFLALPLTLILKYYPHSGHNVFFNRTKIFCITIASLAALTMSLKPTEFLSKKDLLLARLLPPEIAFYVISVKESSQVSALSSFESVVTPMAIAKIQNLRLHYHVPVSTVQGINPNNLFKFLPLGFSLIRGAPTHAVLLLHFHYLQRR